MQINKRRSPKAALASIARTMHLVVAMLVLKQKGDFMKRRIMGWPSYDGVEAPAFMRGRRSLSLRIADIYYRDQGNRSHLTSYHIIVKRISMDILFLLSEIPNSLYYSFYGGEILFGYRACVNYVRARL